MCFPKTSYSEETGNMEAVMKPSGYFLKFIQGALVGLGAVLPGISGGVLSVVFGIYRPAMEFLANPSRYWRSHLPILLPALFGAAVGFLGVANLLAAFLTRYPESSVCIFVGLILGMLPSLLKEAGKQGIAKGSCTALLLSAMTALVVLCGLNASHTTITPNFFWYLFCGFCLALSLIAPGMSFSTLLMPLNLYTPFVDGLGHLLPNVLIPGGIGALFAFLTLPKLVNRLLKRHYSVTFHAITGIVIAATAVTVPYKAFMGSALENGLCMAGGILCSLLLDRLNGRMQGISESGSSE